MTFTYTKQMLAVPSIVHSDDNLNIKQCGKILIQFRTDLNVWTF